MINMKFFKLNTGVLLALLLAISSCQEDDILTESIPIPKKSQFEEGMIKLGKKLENPYTVENMRKAYQNLSGNPQLESENISESEIEVTHLYVRFLPQSEEDYALLSNDTTLQLFDYPLDYEIEEGGTYYHDPELPDSGYTWKYCAVEKDHDFPDLEYEIIEELFLPESMQDETFLESIDDWSFWDDLEIEALKITGNLDEPEDAVRKSRWRRKKWKPSGRITVDDDSGLGRVPVVGCKVRAYSWFTIKSDLTNGSGYFYINRNFKGHVNYSIKWERVDYDIRSGNWGQAYYNGPRYKQKAWNLNIGKGGLSWVYAHVHRAAFRYWYNNTYGIKTPPKNRVWKRKVKIGVMDKGGTPFFRRSNRWTTFPIIKIYRKWSNGTILSSQDIYESTIHELAHASHWALDKSTFLKIISKDHLIVIESWAVGVEHVFATDVYGTSIHDWNNLTFADINGHYKSIYTPLVIDLIDNINQRATNRNSKDYPIDRVNGFTLGQIEDALEKVVTLKEWRDNLKSRYNISTDKRIDELFENYINL